MNSTRFLLVVATVLSFVSLNHALTSVSSCEAITDCYDCTASIQGSTPCGWCLSDVVSFCNTTSEQCNKVGDQQDQWIISYNGGNPMCTGGCETAVDCTECSTKPNCGYCHMEAGCIETRGAGNCTKGAFTVGTCVVPCEYLTDSCQTCLNNADTVNCQWCSTNDADPHGGYCSDFGLTCASNVTTTMTVDSVCAAFPEDSGSSTLNFGLALCVFGVVAALYN